jgi:CysZ protein
VPTRSPDASGAGPTTSGLGSELLAGVGLLGRGLGLIIRRPRLFLLGALPPLITSVIFVVLLVIMIRELDPLLQVLTPFADRWTTGTATLIRTLIGVALVAGAILIMVLVFTTLTLAIGSPLYDKLSESVEREFGPVPELDEPLSRGVVRAVRQTCALIAVSVLGAAVLFGLGFIPVVGQTVVPVVSAMFGGWMLAVELVGSTLERRGLVRIADRLRAMRAYRARVLGFAVPAFLLLAIPFVGVVVFPVATAGGTLLARQLLGAPTDARPTPPRVT